jgi:hypothetical protein|tara:strand:- start:118 stop:360 length:243 start_codon:yes stop_codon:yes gene_type:complete
MRQTEITSYTQASEDLYNKAREALKILSVVVATHDLPMSAVDDVIALRSAIWEMERWMGIETKMAVHDHELKIKIDGVGQ